MASDPNGELQRLLGDDFKLVAKVSADERSRLHALILAAQARQRDAVRTAQQHALRFVPALLRNPLLKLLGE